MPGHIAAIDGRDVLRIQRMKIPRVIPVIEMASKLFQPVHGAESVFEPFRGRLNSNPTKVAGRERREQIQSHIRR